MFEQIRKVVGTPAHAAFDRLKQTWEQSTTPIKSMLGGKTYTLFPTWLQRPYLCFDADNQASKLCNTNVLTVEFKLAKPLGTGIHAEITLEFSADTPEITQSWINTSATWQRHLSFDEQIKPLAIEPGIVSSNLYLPAGTQAIYLHALQSTSGDVAIKRCRLRSIQAFRPLIQNVQRNLRDSPSRLRQGSELVVRAVRRPTRDKLRDVRDWLREQIQHPVTRQSVWQYYFDHITDADRAQITADIEAMASTPTFSILMPTYNTPEPLLRAAILSVQRQLYPHWQLCIADDASPMPHVSRTIRAMAAKDPRISFVQRKKNGHISEATNSALRLAKHPWLALFDHDDELPEHALYMVAKAIQDHPEAKLIYSDEDKCDTHGNRLGPHFKPDFGPDLLRSQNFVSHLGVYDKDLVKQVGGFRTAFNGSQDYDLVLRITEKLTSQQIVHIPHVLYHWRIIPGSAASGSDQKPYAYIAAEKALAEHLVRKGQAGLVRPAEHLGLYHTHYDVPQAQPKVAIFILNFDVSEASVVRSAMAIKRHTNYKNHHIHLILDADAASGTYKLEHQIRAADAIHRTTKEQVTQLLQKLIEQTEAEVCVFMQAGAMPTTDDWLEELVANATRAETGVIGPRLLRNATSVQYSGLVLAESGDVQPLYTHAAMQHVGYFGKAKLAQNFTLISPACFAIHATKLQEVGGLDPNVSFEANVFDLCFRLRSAGYYQSWVPHARISMAYRQETPVLNAISRLPDKDRAIMHDRWHTVLTKHDPFYNPNLAFSADASTLSLPPRHNFCFRAT